MAKPNAKGPVEPCKFIAPSANSSYLNTEKAAKARWLNALKRE